jgi:hypothetical protein
MHFLNFIISLFLSSVIRLLSLFLLSSPFLACPPFLLLSFPSLSVTLDGIIKLLRRLGTDSKEYIPPAYVAWRAGTTALFLLGS